LLEGDRAEVWRTFERIREDERHAQVTLVQMGDAEKRIFGNWWMGLVRPAADTEAAFKPYLREGRLQPKLMSAREIRALMLDLARLSLSREINQCHAA
jgi:hypothetical protein